MREPQIKLMLYMLLVLMTTACIFYIISKNTVPYDFRSTVVKIYSLAGHGSGSVVYSDKDKSLILTNKHVCDGITYTPAEDKRISEITKDAPLVCMFGINSPGCQEIIKQYNDYIKTIDHIGRPVSIMFNNIKRPNVTGLVYKISKNYDLCLVKINVGKLPVIQISRDDVVAGDKVLSIGNPLFMTNAQTEGYVGDFTMHEGRRYRHHTGIIYGGNSGGPVCSYDRGELVGVNTLGTDQPTASYMIPLKEIKEFLKDFI